MPMYMFSWSDNLQKKEYLPRVQYKNIILSPQKWKISPSRFPKYKDLKGSELRKEIISWQEKCKLPEKFLLTFADNKLIIDLNNEKYLPILTEHFKKGRELEIEEVLHSETSYPLVTRNGQRFTNEIILCFHKQ